MTALLLAIVLSADPPAQQGYQPRDYATAYRTSMTTDRPLLILITTAQCPPCAAIKRDVLPVMLRSQSIQGVEFCQVDETYPLFAPLLNGGPVPQLLLYRRVGPRWQVRQLVGYHTAEAVAYWITQ